MVNKERKSIIPKIKDWQKHWVDMPEFNHKNKQGCRQLIIHFDTEEDVQEFAELIDQKITHKTKFLWFPKMQIEKFMHKRYTDKKKKKKK